ncbi:MAG: orotidine-5'-phosphate decarboxylase [Pseudomonadota bacterium]
MHFPHAHSRLCLALDVTDRKKAEALILATEGSVGIYKIGLEFAMAGGLGLAAELAAAGRSVFLDMKLLDIANTVAGAVRSAGALGADYLTVHAYPQALEAAVAARPPGLKIVAVTVLTSLDDGDLLRAGYATSSADLVAKRIGDAAALGVDALVCSPKEAPAAHSSGLLVITPGVRLESDTAGDQKRIATPDAAIEAGADILVVGRPITAAPDPGAAARRFVEAIGAGLERRNRSPASVGC